jgi:hypothetical protein
VTVDANIVVPFDVIKYTCASGEKLDPLIVNSVPDTPVYVEGVTVDILGGAATGTHPIGL